MCNASSILLGEYWEPPPLIHFNPGPAILTPGSDIFVSGDYQSVPPNPSTGSFAMSNPFLFWLALVGGVAFMLPAFQHTVPTLFSKRQSKIDEEEVSKRYLKKGPKKGPNMMICWTPQCGSSVVNNFKIDEFHVFVLGRFGVSFWGRFGGQNGGQKHEKVVPKSHSKTGTKNCRFLVDFGIPLGTLLEPERGK